MATNGAPIHAAQICCSQYVALVPELLTTVWMLCEQRLANCCSTAPWVC
jgi:hypothetical protein